MDNATKLIFQNHPFEALSQMFKTFLVFGVVLGLKVQKRLHEN